MWHSLIGTRVRHSGRAAAMGWALVTAALVCPSPAAAQRFDATFYGGTSLPFYEGSVTVRPNIPSFPGLDVEADSDLPVAAGGGLVFGGSVAWQPGLIGIEGRVDTADLNIRTEGMRLNVLLGGVLPVGSVAVGAGNWDLRRLVVLSVNARIRTPGRVALIASGGLSYLPRFEVGGSVPLTVSALDVVGLPAVNIGLRLDAVPGQSSYGLGANGGGGLGIKLSPATTLLAEARVFAFRSFDLDFAADEAGADLDNLVGRLPLVEFNPAYFQAGFGLIVSF